MISSRPSIGATVARKTGLTVGSTFQPTHGASDGHQHDPFTVVGVLAPTGTPNDRRGFINIEGFYLLDNHAKPLEGYGDEPGAGEKPDHADTDHDHADPDHWPPKTMMPSMPAAPSTTITPKSRSRP